MKTIKISLTLILIVALVIAAIMFDLQQALLNSLEWISGLGVIAPVIFIAIYILACVAFLPGAILTLGAGVVFGVVKGSIVVSIGSTLGAACAFLVGRYLVRGWITNKIAGNENFKAIDEAVALQGWKIVLLMRLSPIFPFNLLNYAFGLTKVSIKQYFLASWAGMIPGTVMYVYIGSLAGDMASISAGSRTRSTGEWVLYGVGLLATVAVTVFVARIARKAIASRIPMGENQ